MKKILPLFYIGGFLIIVFFFTQYKPDISPDVLRKKYANEYSKFIMIDGMPVHYRIEGNGQPLVLIHGTSSSLHAWDAWTQILKHDFTIVRLDLPAFGLTGPNARHEYAIEYYVAFLDSFLNKLHIDTFSMAGVSLGGNIAWLYAVTYPEKVKKLILIDAAGYPREDLPRLFRYARMPIIPRILRYFTPRWLVERNLKEVFYNDTLITEALIDRHYELMLRQGNRDAFLARMKYLRFDAHEKIKNIQCPTLILWGKQDTWIPPAHALRFKEDIRHAVLKFYERAGHVPNEELPLETARDARRFLLANEAP